MLLRVIWLLLIVWLIWRLAKKVTPQPHEDSSTTELVACEQCGVFIARSASYRHKGKNYCSNKKCQP